MHHYQVEIKEEGYDETDEDKQVIGHFDQRFSIKVMEENIIKVDVLTQMRNIEVTRIVGEKANYYNEGYWYNLF